MAKKKKDTQNLTQEQLQQELNYLVKEGFVIYNPDDQTYRMKSEEEIQADIENV
jgi:ribosomal protein L29